MKNITVNTLILSQDYKGAGSLLAHSQNQAGIKTSVLFSTIGRDLFTIGATLADINAFADVAREAIHCKKALSENLRLYVIRGYNDQLAKSAKEGDALKPLHFWSAKPNAPAIFTFEAKPAKAPKVKTASGVSDAPTGTSAPDSSNSTPDKGAAIIESGLPLTIADVARAYHAGRIQLVELAQLVDDLTAQALVKQINKSKKADKKAA